MPRTMDRASAETACFSNRIFDLAVANIIPALSNDRDVSYKAVCHRSSTLLVAGPAPCSPMLEVHGVTLKAKYRRAS